VRAPTISIGIVHPRACSSPRATLSPKGTQPAGDANTPLDSLQPGSYRVAKERHGDPSVGWAQLPDLDSSVEMTRLLSLSYELQLHSTRSRFCYVVEAFKSLTGSPGAD
jgi:hypothetical protein